MRLLTRRTLRPLSPSPQLSALRVVRFSLDIRENILLGDYGFLSNLESAQLCIFDVPVSRLPANVVEACAELQTP